MKKIIVGTDFSENGNHAVNYAARLARDLHLPLTLVCGFQMPVVSSMDAPMSAVSVHEIRHAYQENLNELLDETKKKFTGITCEALLDFGSGWEVLSKQADADDLIVTGESGTGSRMGIILGSTPRELIRNAHKNVLVVPLETAYKPLVTIALAVDLKKEVSLDKFNLLKDVAKNFSANISIITILDREHPLDVNKAIQGLSVNNVFSDIQHTFHLPEDDNIASGIADFCRNHQMELLALMPGEHHFFERLLGKSITAEVLSIAKLPVLCIPS
jgi:nucleotide-binding universal stress UspA family protein